MTDQERFYGGSQFLNTGANVDLNFAAGRVTVIDASTTGLCVVLPSPLQRQIGSPVGIVWNNGSNDVQIIDRDLNDYGALSAGNAAIIHLTDIDGAIPWLVEIRTPQTPVTLSFSGGVTACDSGTTFTPIDTGGGGGSLPGSSGPTLGSGSGVAAFFLEDQGGYPIGDFHVDFSGHVCGIVTEMVNGNSAGDPAARYTINRAYLISDGAGAVEAAISWNDGYTHYMQVRLDGVSKMILCDNGIMGGGQTGTLTATSAGQVIEFSVLSLPTGGSDPVPTDADFLDYDLHPDIQNSNKFENGTRGGAPSVTPATY